MPTADARNAILQRIHKALGRQQPEANIGDAFQRLTAGQGLQHQTLSVIDHPLQRFCDQASASGARFAELESVALLPEWLAKSHGKQHPIALSRQPEISDLDWSAFTISANYRSSARTGVVKACFAAAETGTLCLHSADVPSGLLYLVETLVVVIERKDIKARYEDIWNSPPFTGLISAHTPRAVHLITGPSRTADVEQTLQVGAHGPRQLLIAIC